MTGAVIRMLIGQLFVLVVAVAPQARPIAKIFNDFA